MEPGVQTCEETLTNLSGSCRDSAWLLVQILRNLGIAARFASGYLIQLVPDVKSLDGPSGTDRDFTDLHAWTEVYMPGAGWIGLDPTSGLLTGEGHIPLACTPDPTSAAPITGGVDACETEFDFAMSVSRIHEDPRVTKPYSDEQWQQIEAVGHDVDQRLQAGDVRLTMGGEPTFVSIDDMEGAEWTTAAVGPTKRRLAAELFLRLQRRFAPEQPAALWTRKMVSRRTAAAMGVQLLLAKRWRTGMERIDVRRRRRQGLRTHRSGCGTIREIARRKAWKLIRSLPSRPTKTSGITSPRSGGFPSTWILATTSSRTPKNGRGWLALPSKEWERSPAMCCRCVANGGKPRHDGRVDPGRFAATRCLCCLVTHQSDCVCRSIRFPGLRLADEDLMRLDPSAPRDSLAPHPYQRGKVADACSKRLHHPKMRMNYLKLGKLNRHCQKSKVVKTAMCVEPRNGTLHVFMPPTERLEDYLDLVAAVEQTAETRYADCRWKAIFPRRITRLHNIKVTPDPGVIEVNTHPAGTWDELVESTTALYEEAFLQSVGHGEIRPGRSTHRDGRREPRCAGRSHDRRIARFLRRPDLLKSLIALLEQSSVIVVPFFQQLHRSDESGSASGRRTARCVCTNWKLPSIRCLTHLPGSPSQSGDLPPWLVDRIFRNLLVDLTGNTHRAEFCIDKLYSPDSSTGRLGLVEFRGFEMPPHGRMSLTQQLLLRSLVARFWQQPYREKLVHWGTTLHDRFLLPHFVWSDLAEVIDEIPRLWNSA